MNLVLGRVLVAGMNTLSIASHEVSRGSLASWNRDRRDSGVVDFEDIRV